MTEEKRLNAKHLEPHFIQTVAITVTETEKVLVSMEAKSTEITVVKRYYLLHISKI